MADKRAYFKLDVGYLSNPKVLGIMDESPTAVLLHIASIAYAAQHLTDGDVPIAALLRMTGASKEDAELLYETGLLIPGSGKSVTVHDYLQHQRSAADVKGASEAGKRAANIKWDAERNATRMRTAEGHASEIGMPRERERKKEETLLSDEPDDTDPDRFEEFWEAYTRKGGKKPSRAKWNAALKKRGVTPDLLITAATAYISHQQAENKHPEFTKGAERWLSGEHWSDELPTAEAQSSTTPNWASNASPPSCPPEVADDYRLYDQWLEDWREGRPVINSDGETVRQAS